MFRTVLILLVVLILATLCLCDVVNEDEVLHLPGLKDKPPYRHYSGYLQASPTHFLHYWFVEAVNNPATSPLVFWLNGGPGCSSLGGMLEELGPFFRNDDGETLRTNPYAWNKDANVVFLESPAGVGYSYSSDFNISTGDAQTADENYVALKDFYRKFPQYRRQELYITGESYGGTYIPMFVARILDGMDSFDVNLKGLAIGNGCMKATINTDSLVQFIYGHGLLDESEYQLMETACCGGCADTCAWHSAKPPMCQKYVADAALKAWVSGLNPYDVYRDCFNPTHKPLGDTYRAAVRGLAPANVVDRLNHIDSRQSAADDDDTIIVVDPICTDEFALTHYMNQESVRRQTHIHPQAPDWVYCRNEISVTYRKENLDKTPEILKAVNAGLKVLLYFGDTDMACNFLQGQLFTKQLGLPLIQPKRPWRVRGQITGFVTQYKNLDYVTVKGAGHMVPQWRSEPALHMFQSWLKSTPY